MGFSDLGQWQQNKGGTLGMGELVMSCCMLDPGDQQSWDACWWTFSQTSCRMTTMINSKSLIQSDLGVWFQRFCLFLPRSFGEIIYIICLIIFHSFSIGLKPPRDSPFSILLTTGGCFAAAGLCLFVFPE